MSASQVYEIIKDYQCDYENRKFEVTPEHIQNWANQFGDDANFVLSELIHFLPEVYISKEKAKSLLRKHLIYLQKLHNYRTMNELIMNSHFFDSQKPEKSQGELLIIIDDILQTEFMINFKSLESYPKKHYIYFDDILATGGTIFKNLKKWLDSEEGGVKQSDAVLDNKKTLAICLFCHHQLGFSNFEWQLMKDTNDKIKKLLIFSSSYVIENHLKTKWIAEKQRLNCAYPIQEQPREVIEYLNSLEAVNDTVPAFRNKELPKKETFFSSPENRVKLENLFLNKGIELINKIRTENFDRRKRPLGDTVKSHKTLGTGTLFFTWRNISNTCPLVFWWDVPGHNWIPLFCVKNRGN